MFRKTPLLRMLLLVLGLLSTLLILPALAQRDIEQDSATAVTLTQALAPLQINQMSQLTGSYKTGPYVVETGDSLTYTLVLSNGYPMTVTFELTDPLLSDMVYVPNSLSCVGGLGTCYLDAGDSYIGWAGDILAGDSVTVTFAVDLTASSCGQVVTNEAVVHAYAMGTGTVILPGTGSLLIDETFMLTHTSEVWDQITYYNNFEVDDGGLNVAVGEWQWGELVHHAEEAPTTAHSGHSLWATNLDGDISTEPSQHTLTQTISLPIFNEGYLRWWDWWHGDGLDLSDVTINGQQVYQIEAIRQELVPWQEHWVNLNPWQNETVDLTFHYDAGGASDGGAGWYLDDLMIVSCAPPETPYLETSYKTGPHWVFNGESFTYTVTVQNASTAVISEAMLIDGIPAGSTYVNGSVSNGATYNSTLNQIEASAPFSSGQKMNVSFMVMADTTNLNLLNTAAISADSLTETVWVTAQTEIINPLDYPSCIDFETGYRPGNMFTETTHIGIAQGTAVVSAEGPQGGLYGFDLYTDNGDVIQGPHMTRQAGIFVYTGLSDATAVELNFWLRGYGDEFQQDFDLDGIYLSNDGETYSKIYTFPPGNFPYRNIALSLSDLANQGGIDLTEQFFLKFQSFDNNAIISGDGYSIDNLCLQPLQPNLSQSAKLAPGGVLADEVYTYTVYISNTGTIAAEDVTFTDPIPAGASYIPGSVTNGATYNSSTNQIEWSGSVMPNELVVFTFAVMADGAEGSTIINVGTVNDTNIPMPVVFTKSTKIVYPVSFPTCLDFETGDIPDFMFTERTSFAGSEARAEVSDDYPHSGTYAFNLDTENPGNFTRQAGGFVIDLDGATPATLNFWVQAHQDEPHPEDGVFISQHGAGPYYKIHTLPLSTTYQNIVLDLVGEATNLGFSIEEPIFIKFQSYDDFSIPSDGYSLDDICVQPPAPHLGVTKVDAQDPVMVGDPITYTIVVQTQGLTDLTTIALSDTLPSNVLFSSFSSSMETCNVGSSITCTFALTDTAAISNGLSITMTLVVTTTEAGVVTNTVAISGDTERVTDGDKVAVATTVVFGDILPPLYGSAPDLEGLSSLYEIDPLSGMMTLLGPIGFANVGGLDVHPVSGLLYGTGNQQDGDQANVLLLIDPISGVGLEIGATGIEDLGYQRILDVSFRNSDQTLFATAYSGNGNGTLDLGSVQLGSINLITGQFTPIGNPVEGRCCDNGLAFSLNNTLYQADSHFLRLINQATGSTTSRKTMTFTPPVDGTRQVNGLDFLPAENILFGSLNDGTINIPESYLVIIETQTGVGNVITPTVPGLNGVAFGPATPLDDIANLNVMKMDWPDPAIVGQPFTYTVVISNSLNDTTNLVVTDTLPAAVSLSSVTASNGTCSGTAVIVCDLGSLAADDAAKVTIVVVPDTAGLISNTVTASSDLIDPVLRNNMAVEYTTILPAELPPLYGATSPPDQSATLHSLNLLTGEATTIGEIGFTNVSGLAVHPTSQILYGVGQRNDESQASVLLQIDPVRGAGFEVGPTGIEALSQTRLSDISFRPDGSLYAYAENGNLLGTLAVDTGAFNGIGNVNVMGCCGNGLAFSDSDWLYHANDATVNVLNPSDATTVMSMTLTFVPPPTVQARLNALAVIPETEIVVGDLDRGEIGSPDNYLVIVQGHTAMVNPIALTLPGLAAIAFGPAVEIVPVSDLGVTKQASPNPVKQGMPLTYTMVVTNGAEDNTGVILTDTLPADVSLTSADSTQGTCSGTTTITCSLGDLTAGAHVTVTIVAVPTVSGVMTNTVWVSGEAEDPMADNNEASATVTVIPLESDLGVMKSTTPNPVVAGQPLTYTIVVSNTLDDNTGVVLTDTLSTMTTLAMVSSTQGSCTGTTTVVCALGDVPADTTVMVTLVVTPTAPGVITNTVWVAGEVTDPQLSNNQASVTTEVIPAGYITYLPLVMKQY